MNNRVRKPEQLRMVYVGLEERGQEHPEPLSVVSPSNSWWR